MRWVLVSAVALAACPGSKATQDAGTGGDAGTASDAGTDAGSDAGGTVIVTGTVYLQRGIPAAGRTVSIKGLPSALTDANGMFSIPGVTPPYDLAVVNGPLAVATVYVGLSRTDPMVRVFEPTTTRRSATLSGNVTGGSGLSIDPIYVLFSSRDTSNTVQADGGAYAMTGSNDTLYWSGADKTTGLLSALQVKLGPDGLPQTFPGYGSQSFVTLSDGLNVSMDVPITQQPLPETLSGTVTAPVGYTVSEKDVYLRVDAGPGGLWFIADTSASAAFSYTVPAAEENSFDVRLYLNSPQNGLVRLFHPAAPGNGAALTLNPPAGPGLIQPVDNATGITLASTFAWSSVPQAVHELQFVQNSISQLRYTVLTASSQAQIPDLSALGISLPSGEAYSWVLRTWSPAASLDAFASPTGADLLDAMGSSESSVALSPQRTLTTQ